jgi:hypothetical protein
LIIRRQRKHAESLREMVDCLPHETRVAMLDGLQRYAIIAGAYSDRRGGVCPMLAAHRCGGRTDFRPFARAWDRFTGAHKRARRATERELRTLTSQLEASLWSDGEVLELRAQADRLANEAAGKPQTAQHRKRRVRTGAAWLRPFREWDDYRAAVAAVEREVEQDPQTEVDAELTPSVSGCPR